MIRKKKHYPGSSSKMISKSEWLWEISKQEWSEEDSSGTMLQESNQLTVYREISNWRPEISREESIDRRWRTNPSTISDPFDGDDQALFANPRYTRIKQAIPIDLIILHVVH